MDFCHCHAEQIKEGFIDLFFFLVPLSRKRRDSTSRCRTPQCSLRLKPLKLIGICEKMVSRLRVNSIILSRNSVTCFRICPSFILLSDSITPTFLPVVRICQETPTPLVPFCVLGVKHSRKPPVFNGKKGASFLTAALK